MKLTIGKKLTAGFAILAVVVLISGLTGMSMVKKVASSMEVIAGEKVIFKDVAMEAMLAAENAVSACRGHLLAQDDRELEKAAADIEEYLGDFDMFVALIRHGSESTEFKNSPAGAMYVKDEIDMIVPQGSPPMLELIEKIDPLQKNFVQKAREMMAVHQDKQRYFFSVDDNRYSIETFFYEVIDSHRNWFKNLEMAVEYEVDFGGELDPAKCFLGANLHLLPQDDEELSALQHSLSDVHAKFHELGKEIMASPPEQRESLLVRGTRIASKRSRYSLNCKNTLPKKFLHLKPGNRPLPQRCSKFRRS